MRLKRKNETPPGGWRYLVDIPGKASVMVTGESKRNILQVAKSTMMNNGVPIPENLDLIIEDWICGQIPDGHCYYTSGLGDQLSRVIHGAAGVVDAVAGTQLKKAAKGCKSCGSRRRRLNG